MIRLHVFIDNERKVRYLVIIDLSDLTDVLIKYRLKYFENTVSIMDTGV